MEQINHFEHDNELQLYWSIGSSKTYREGLPFQKTKRNKGEKDMYVIDDDHEPIISLEDFQMAQELRKQRSELSNNKGHRPTRNRYTKP